MFYLTEQFDHARRFLNADAGSEWTNNVEVALLLREGKKSEAVERLHRMPESAFFHTRALEACYSTPRPAGSEQLLEEAAKALSTFSDPEPRYTQAGLFNACLGNAFTARIVKSAIDGGYCAYDYLQVDSMLKEFRKSSEYPALLAEAKRCQDRFLAERDHLVH